jgi:flagellar L-ring protein precursor FlgH
MNPVRNGSTALVVFLGGLGLGGCQTVPTRDPDFAPVRPVAMAVTPSRNGALYSGANEVAVLDVDLFSDIRPRRVGDSLTIRLVERTAASKKAETNVDQSNNVAVANPTLFGTQPNFRLGDTQLTLQQSLNSSKAFDGQGESSQSNSLVGDITVTVVDVLPNGNLLVRGEKILTLNRGHEHVRFSGLVRPMDISPDNTVPSTRVADATIVYSGEGEVANASAIGWLARFFLSPLFPF